MREMLQNDELSLFLPYRFTFLCRTVSTYGNTKIFFPITHTQNYVNFFWNHAEWGSFSSYLAKSCRLSPSKAHSFRTLSLIYKQRRENPKRLIFSDYFLFILRPLFDHKNHKKNKKKLKASRMSSESSKRSIQLRAGQWRSCGSRL